MACLSAANRQKVSNTGVNLYSISRRVSVIGGGAALAKWSWEPILGRLLDLDPLPSSMAAAVRFIGKEPFGSCLDAFSQLEHGYKCGDCPTERTACFTKNEMSNLAKRSQRYKVKVDVRNIIHVGNFTNPTLVLGAGAGIRNRRIISRSSLPAKWQILAK